MSSDATDEGVYVIQFNDYKKNLPKSLKQFYDANLFSDAEIITMDGGCFSVHRVVLSANSPFFLKVFTKSNRVNASVIVDNVTAEVMKLLLKFMYSGIVELEPEMVPSFICAAEALQIRGLSDKVDGVLDAISVAPIMVDVTDLNLPKMQPKQQTEQTQSNVLPQPKNANARDQNNNNGPKVLAEEEKWLEKTMNMLLFPDENPNDNKAKDNDSDYSMGEEENATAIQPMVSLPKQEPITIFIKKEMIEQLNNTDESDDYGLCLVGKMHGIKLSLDDFLYRRQNMSRRMADKQEIKWLCIRYRTKKCKAIARTIGNQVVSNGANDHNHAAEIDSPPSRLVDMTKFDFNELFLN